MPNVVERRMPWALNRGVVHVALDVAELIFDLRRGISRNSCGNAAFVARLFNIRAVKCVVVI
jgi:hypothetical protein